MELFNLTTSQLNSMTLEELDALSLGLGSSTHINIINDSEGVDNFAYQSLTPINIAGDPYPQGSSKIIRNFRAESYEADGDAVEAEPTITVLNADASRSRATVTFATGIRTSTATIG